MGGRHSSLQSGGREGAEEREEKGRSWNGNGFSDLAGGGERKKEGVI